MIRRDTKVNPFRDYLGFLRQMGDLDPLRSTFLENEAYRFINMIEKTSMSRLYKIPLIMSFFDGNRIVFEPGREEDSRVVQGFLLEGQQHGRLRRG